MAELVTNPEILNQKLEAANALQVAGGEVNWDRSIAAYEEIIAEFGLNAAALNGMGIPLRMRNRQPETIQAFTLARALAHKSGDLEEELIAVNGLMDAWRTVMRDTDEADQRILYPSYVAETARASYLYTISASFIPQAEYIMAQMSTPSLAQIEAHINMGLLYDNIGDIPRALEAYDKAFKVREFVEVQPNNKRYQNRLARALTTIGVTQEKAGKLNEALASQTEARSIYLQLQDSRGIGNSTEGVAEVAVKMGEVELAKKVYEEAIPLCKEDSIFYPRLVAGLAKLQNPQA